MKRSILSKPVSQYTLQGELVKVHNSIAEASKYSGIHPSSIWASCAGASYYAFNHIWIYLENTWLEDTEKKSLNNRVGKVNGGDYPRIKNKGK